MGSCLGKKKTADGYSNVSPSTSESMTRRSDDHPYRVIIVGSNQVGKAALLYRYTADKFMYDENNTTNSNSSFGSDNADNNQKVQYEKFSDEWEETPLRKKMIQIGKHELKLFVKAARMVERTIRSQSFRNPYRGMDGLMMVYDITNKESLDLFEDVLVKQLPFYATPNIRVLFVGAKFDEKDSRQLTTDEVRVFVEKMVKQNSEKFRYSISEKSFIEVSSKNGTNVNEAFEILMKLMMTTNTTPP